MDVRVVRRTQVFKELTLDFAERALVVNYAIENVLATPAGEPAGTDVEAHKKRIRLKAIDADTDVPALADAIMRSCDIIPTSKQALLVELLYELQLADTRSARQVSGPGTAYGAGGRGGSAGARSSGQAEGKEGDRSLGSIAIGYNGGGGDGEGDGDGEPEPDARMDKLDDYLEKLYEEEVEIKESGARCIAALANRAENLGALCDNGTLLGALTRVLKDDYKKHTSLASILMQFFFAVAHFKELHALLLSNRIGDTSMRIVELELRRHAARKADAQRFAQLAALQAAEDAAGEAAFRRADAEARQAEEEEADAAAAAAAAAASASDSKSGDGGGKKKGTGKSKKAAAAAEGKDGEATPGVDGEGGGGAGGGLEAARKIKLRPLPAGRVDVDKEERKMRAATRNSEVLTYLCLHVLMNLAEDLDVEAKMCKRGIVGLLVPLLERTNSHLLLLVVNFLRKLSIFEENKNAMVALGVGPKLVALLPQPAAVVSGAAAASQLTVDLFASILHLMFNLTFDPTMCQSFVTSGALSRVGAMLRHAPYRQVCLKLLYRLSCEYAVRGQFAPTDAVALTASMVTKFPQPKLPLELAALAINLSQHADTAEVMLKGGSGAAAAAEGGGGSGGAIVRQLVARLVKTRDPAVAKVLRGLSQLTYALAADAELRAHAAAEQAEGAATPALIRVAQQAQAHMHARAKGGAGAGAGAGTGAGGRPKRGESKDAEDEHADGDEDDEEEEAGAADAIYAPWIGCYTPEHDAPLEYDWPYAGVWTPHILDLVRCLKLAEAEEQSAVAVELWGLLANMPPREMPSHSSAAATFADLLQDADLLSALLHRLSPAHNAEDDILLEAVQFVSAAAVDPDAASLLAGSPALRLLGDVLAEKAGDPDIVLQTLTAILKLLHHPDSRAVLVSQTKVPARVVELCGHPHERIASEAEAVTYLCIEHDREHGNGSVWRHLQLRRFQIYNREWFKAAAASSGGGGGSGIALGQGGAASRRQVASLGYSSSSGSGAGAMPAAYVADDAEESYGDEYEDSADADDSGAGAGSHGYGSATSGRGGSSNSAGGSNSGSPLQHMGRRGEAVAFDVSYLFDRTGSGLTASGGGRGGGRGSGAARGGAGTGAGAGAGGEDDEGEVSAEVRAYMAQFMQRDTSSGSLNVSASSGGGGGADGAFGRQARYSGGDDSPPGAASTGRSGGGAAAAAVVPGKAVVRPSTATRR